MICATGIYAYMKKWTTSLQSSNTCLNTDNPAEGCKVYVLFKGKSLQKHKIQ